MAEHRLFQLRSELFPLTTRLEHLPAESRLTIAGCDLAALAKKWGTPLYIFDRLTLDASVEAYRMALAKHYPGQSGVTYAGKAYLSLALAQWVDEQNLWLDCTGAGELCIAAAAGFPHERILVHGVNKSPEDLQAALGSARVIVVDNLTELERLAAAYRSHPASFPDLWLRFRPGLAVDTHAYTQTGQDDSKFGMSAVELYQAVQICLSQGLPLTGLHFHQGSHFHDPAPLGPAIQTALDVLKELSPALNWYPKYFCTGGGWGVAYHENDLPQPAIEQYVAFICQNLIKECQAMDFPLPHLQLEPGRSLVARAGVAIYRVGAVKRTAHRRWLLLDGGLADNPRPALYRARYSALPVLNPDRPATEPAWLAGPYCESGDILIEGLPLPDMEADELIAIPVGGAYQLSMSSNYNGARRPAVLWLEDGTARLIQRRETLEDLLRRDVPLHEPGAA